MDLGSIAIEGRRGRAGLAKLWLIPALLLLSCNMWGSCTSAPCEVTLPTTAATASIASSSLGSSPIRIEGRLIGQNWASGSVLRPVATFGGFGIQYNSINQEVYFECVDTTNPNGCGNFSIRLTTYTDNDVLFRFQRNPTTMLLTLEIYDTQTGTSLYNTGSASAPIVTLASGSTIQSYGVSVGGSNASGNLGFLRVFNTAVAVGTPIPVAISSPANLGDWEFIGNGNDTSGNSQTMSGLSSYSSAPTYNPACNAGAQQSVNLGSTISLNGTASYPLDGGTTLTYAWSAFTGSDGVSQGYTISSPTSAITSTTATTAFGSADIQLVITDSHSNSATCNVHNGVYIADSSGVIDLTSEGVGPQQQALIGPMIAMGQNPWPFADSTQEYTLNQQINNLQNYYTPYWETSLGSSSITSGNAYFTVASGGLAPCGGSGSTPLTGAEFVWIYTGTDTLTHYTHFPITACNSATQITVAWNNNGNVSATAYPSSPATPWPSCSSGCNGGWTWQCAGCSTSPYNQWGNWIYNAAPANYYDNVKDFYNAYFRSGIDTFLYWGRKLADWFWEMPLMDQGYGCSQNNPVSACFEPVSWRSMSMDGIFLRALEQGGGSSKWAGIHIIESGAELYLGTYWPTWYASSGTLDVRENAYVVAILANCGLSDPNSTAKSGCQSALKAAVQPSTGFYATIQRPDLDNTWGGFQLYGQNTGATSISALNGGVTNISVCATNGSSAVTGTNTTWSSSSIPSYPSSGGIWFFTPTGSGTAASFPATNGTTSTTIGDTTSYAYTVNSNTSLTLVDGTGTATAYQGSTGCGKGFVVGNPIGANGYGFIGWGTEPFFNGLLAEAFFRAAQAMVGYDTPSVGYYNAFADANIQMIATSGVIQSDTGGGNGGMDYGAFYVGCTPPLSPSSYAQSGCYPSGYNQSQSRTNMLEVGKGFALDYLYNHSATIASAMGTIMSRMFSTPTSGPNYDGYYITDFVPGTGFYVTGTPPLGTAPKWTGQQCGFAETCSAIPAVAIQTRTRLGPRMAGKAGIQGTTAIQ